MFLKYCIEVKEQDLMYRINSQLEPFEHLSEAAHVELKIVENGALWKEKRAIETIFGFPHRMDKQKKCPLSTFVPWDNTTRKPYFEFDFSRLQDLSKRAILVVVKKPWGGDDDDE
ncbi:hypothetical protein PPTG_24248 [Phytophthora nicotianae INRA-310]|uniref:Uncharacterized protein n=1 Tax=Phytophthora nicotianae (strain INRA-310) TaxID=761204 RepID=W2PKC0_PHYN3|nr:hypothetical protein PPTG_24248 [Phytophthora nicotianae INRA-310]ETN00490.1 hypothetical protein PPTG_24248 [Phytophthora nicotianae INRA-310]